MSTALTCAGCGADATPPPLRFACACVGDGGDHVLTRPAPAPTTTTPTTTPTTIDALATGDEPNPFLRYRHLGYPWQLARAAGLTDADYVAMVRTLDAAVAAVDGRGFACTPYRAVAPLAQALGLGDEQLWVKDETGHVAGSHKARHLFGLALVLAVAERTGLLRGDDARRPLAIASCGNAALAAAVVARAAGRALQVFVPPWADPPVVERLRALGAELRVCPRLPDDPPGDPCHHRFRAAVAAGALPFSCQGSDNGLTIDGGMTLGFELAEQTAAAPVARVLVQVGGGALASALAQGLSWAHALGAVAHLPALHPVQTEGCFPLARAWRRIARQLAAELRGPAPAHDLATDEDGARADAACARYLAERASADDRRRALTRAAAARASAMWPWEREPASAASGILDDETYDYLAIVRALLDTGGWPVVAAEPAVLEAQRLGKAAGYRVSATGAAGLAGALALRSAGLLPADQRVAVLFTGVER